MDLRNGETYETKAEALAAGVPESDVAEVIRGDATVPEVRFIDAQGTVWVLASYADVLLAERDALREQLDRLRANICHWSEGMEWIPPHALVALAWEVPTESDFEWARKVASKRHVMSYSGTCAGGDHSHCSGIFKTADAENLDVTHVCGCFCHRHVERNSSAGTS